MAAAMGNAVNQSAPHSFRMPSLLLLLNSCTPFCQPTLHRSWDREPDIPGARPIQQIMLDFHACSWVRLFKRVCISGVLIAVAKHLFLLSQTSVPGLSSADDSIARHLDALNDPAFEGMLADIGEGIAAAELQSCFSPAADG